MELSFPGLKRLSESSSSEKFLESSSWRPPFIGNVYAASKQVSREFSDELSCAFCPPNKAHTFKKSIIQISADDVVSCPGCHYQHKRMDLATTFKISDVRKCPCCQEHGESLPGFFNAGECRLLLKQERESSFSTLTCFTYVAHGRLAKYACRISRHQRCMLQGSIY